MKRGRAEELLAEAVDAVRAWPELADAAGIDEARFARIAACHRLALPVG
jgi:serine/threonine-protein kinase HipA